MPSPVPIIERVERRMLTLMQAITGIGTVRRYDSRALVGHVPLDGYLRIEDAQCDEDSITLSGTNLWTIDFACGVWIMTDDAEAKTTSQLINEWCARIETALTHIPLKETGSGTPIIAQQVTPTNRIAIDLDDGVTEAAVTMTALVHTTRGNPYISPWAEEIQE